MQNKDVIRKNWRMWKHGKQWLFSSSALLALAVGMGTVGTVAHAQTEAPVSTQPSTELVEATTQTQPESADNTTTAGATNTPATDKKAATITNSSNTDKSTDQTVQSTTADTIKTASPVQTTEATAPQADSVSKIKTSPTDTTASKKIIATPVTGTTSNQQPAVDTTANSIITVQPVAARVATNTTTNNPATTAVTDSTKVIVHYQGDGTKWVPYVWGLEPNGDGQQYNWTGTDTYGYYAAIDLNQNYQQVGLLIKGTDSWDKDGAGNNRTLAVDDSGKAEAWFKQGSDEAQTVSPTYNQTELHLHYHSLVANNVISAKVWTDKSPAKIVNLNQTDSYGNHLGSLNIPASDFSTIFVQTIGADETIREFTPLPGDVTDIYLVANDQQAYYTPSFALNQELVTSATMTSENNMTVSVGKKISATAAKTQLTLANNAIKSITPVAADSDGLSKTFIITTTNPIDILASNTVSYNGNLKTLDIGPYVRSQAFDDKYYYAGDDLGVTYTHQQTQIKLWAPTATTVRLNLYDSTDNTAQPIQVIQMTRASQGVWTSVLTGNYQGWAYDYQLKFGDGTTTEANDPYSKAVTINGNRSVIEDVDTITPADFNRMPSFTNSTDAIIYETSVRDFTHDSNSGVTNKGKFLGMVETGTKTANGQVTGIDYLKQLGVTHVQLMPMYDFSSIDETSTNPSYNWGYDPKNYDVPEGSYATNASDPTNRILEMKEMINGFHKNGIRVVMDVVYNHVFSMADQSFQKVVPGYYFQYDAAGHTTNGTGVGNDVASERLMVRKYILDSVKYWATNYNIDGFRFDLMGILDVDTMNAIRAELNTIDPSILVYGEGWDMRATDHDIGAAQYNANKVDSKVGFFSDDIRNAIKGSEFGGINPGLVEGNTKESTYTDDAQAFVTGFLGGQGYANATTAHPYQSPTQTINYVACHDNRTLYDMLKALMPDDSSADLVKRDQLATSMAILAQGVPFINSGQEALRTKDGNDNSYNSSDEINEINWDRVQQNQAVVNYFKALVKLRKDEKVFRQTDYAQIAKTIKVLKSGEAGVFAFEYTAGGHQLYVLFNVNDHAIDFDAANLGLGHILLASDETTKLGKVTSLAGLSTLVVREDLPQTVTINYCDQNGKVIQTSQFNLAKAGDQQTLTAPTGYQIVGGTSAVSYDLDSETTAWHLNIPVETIATNSGDNKETDRNNNSQTIDTGDSGATDTITNSHSTAPNTDQASTGEAVGINQGSVPTDVDQSTQDAKSVASNLAAVKPAVPLTAKKSPVKMALPQTDENQNKTASLVGILTLILAGTVGLVIPKQKRN